jgi:hypothetical protein
MLVHVKPPEGSRVTGVVIELAPSELLPGDLVRVHAAWARVLDEPMTVHRGLGIFDDLQILVGASIEFIGHPGSELWTWDPNDRVPVRRIRELGSEYSKAENDARRPRDADSLSDRRRTVRQRLKAAQLHITVVGSPAPRRLRGVEWTTRSVSGVCSPYLSLRGTS